MSKNIILIVAMIYSLSFTCHAEEIIPCPDMTYDFVEDEIEAYTSSERGYQGSDYSQQPSEYENAASEPVESQAESSEDTIEVSDNEEIEVVEEVKEESEPEIEVVKEETAESTEISQPNESTVSEENALNDIEEETYDTQVQDNTSYASVGGIIGGAILIYLRKKIRR